MKRRIVQTRNFSKDIDRLLRRRSLLIEDFEEFEKALIADPMAGDLVLVLEESVR